MSISRLILRKHRLPTTPPGFVAAGTRYNWDDGTVQGWTQEGTQDATFSNPVASGSNGYLRIVKSAIPTNTYTDLFAHRVVNGTAPTIAGPTLRVACKFVSGGAGWYAMVYFKDTPGFEYHTGTSVNLTTAGTTYELLATPPLVPNASGTNVYAYGVYFANNNNQNASVEFQLDDYQQGTIS